MTYAARITALPLPPFDYTQMSIGFGEVGGAEYGYRAATVQALMTAAAVVGYDADTELTALRARVEELERALNQISIMDHGNPYARDCANAARAAITTSKATGAAA